MRESARHGLPLAILAAVAILAFLANYCLHRRQDRGAAAPSPITVVSAGATRTTGSVASSQDHLTLALLGTSLGPGAADKAAVIAIGGGAPRSYRIGDRISPGASLQSIAPDHVDILENGAERRLYLSAAANPPPAEHHDSPKLHALFASLHHHGRLRAGSRKTFHSDDTPAATSQ